ncbi:MazG nucleotide pyrophosphohydrolase domain-containing protein [Longispora sp. K20-0274]|uniref:MazG nucleotide pyrophosphohydrolase domain-containing protein n=1 Tax=Longispora sp. K20-0274 TaxID=3088255 RepID=UPI00399C0759
MTNDRLDAVYAIADAYAAKYGPNTPFGMMTRILEEAGELASAVNHAEDTGAKVAKHGPPDPAQLASEIEDLLHCTLAVARHYRIEHLVDEAISSTLARLSAQAAG